TLVFGPAGIIIGPFLFVMAIEILERREWRSALRVAAGAILGLFGSTVSKLILQLVMIIWFFTVIN
ncbi:MAG: DUF456 domain-containing protein, partial [Halanaerobium sp.]|nr:DUF456 domain-containing protein [Halanaerobium sp.]